MTLTIQEDEVTRSIMEIENTQKMCAMLMKTPHYAKMGQEGIYAIVAKAKAIGVNPIDALNGGFYFVQGKVGMSSEMMACLVRQAGHSIMKDPKSTATNCILIGKRKDNGDTWSVSFSVDDAKKAGIYKENGPWSKYTSSMVYNRAMSMLFRQLFPDLCKGAGYIMEELKEIAGDRQEIKEVPCEVKVDTVTFEQAQELVNLLAECSQEYRDQLWHTLGKPPIAIESLADLPANLYKRIKEAITKKRDENQSQLAMEKPDDEADE